MPASLPSSAASSASQFCSNLSDYGDRSTMNGAYLNSRLCVRCCCMVVAVILIIAAPIQAALPNKPVAWTPAEMLKVKRIGAVQVSPDGQHAVFTVRQPVTDGDKSEYLTHLHLGDVNGRSFRQLTQGDKSCDDPQWSPDGIWIAFLSERSGKKNLWLIR